MIVRVKSLKESLAILPDLNGISEVTFNNELAGRTFVNPIIDEDCYELNNWYIPLCLCDEVTIDDALVEDIFAELMLVSGVLYE